METFNTFRRLAEAIGRIKEMEKTINSQNDLLRNENQNNGSKNANIIEVVDFFVRQLFQLKYFVDSRQQ